MSFRFHFHRNRIEGGLKKRLLLSLRLGPLNASRGVFRVKVAFWLCCVLWFLVSSESDDKLIDSVLMRFELELCKYW